MGLLERFMAKVSPEPTSGCWLWTGANVRGYGQLHLAGKMVRAHRLSYELRHGPLPEGSCVLHECDMPSCVNPDHLKVGSQTENMRDKGLRGRNYNGARTTCPRGHPYSPENTRVYKNGRYCRECHRLAKRARRDR